MKIRTVFQIRHFIRLSKQKAVPAGKAVPAIANSEFQIPNDYR